MDEITKNSCPNCCQQYSLKTLSSEGKSNIPLFIKCGHSMCECCVRKIVQFCKPIECKICPRTMEVKAADIVKLQNKIELYKFFPVNVSLLGELALELITEKSVAEENKAEDYFIDLQAILDTKDQTQGQCLECHSETTKMCQQCATIICEDCFNKSHKNFVVFKNHVLQNIEQQITINNCKIHSQKILEYYCKDCSKSICMDCMMVGSEKSCKSHNVVSNLEMNEMFLSDLRKILPEVDITFRRLTKTAVDIGHLLKTMENEGSPELQQVSASINQHFSKLYAMVQAHKLEVMNNVARLRNIEIESLLRAREDVASAIRESNRVMAVLKSALNSEKNQTTNLSVLFEEAKNIVKKPWCLSKHESNKDTLKVCVSEDLCLLVSDYVQVVGNAQARYALRASHELPDAPPPPRAPVFPPNDVRFNKSKADHVDTTSEEAPAPCRGEGEKDIPVAPKENSSTYSPVMQKTVRPSLSPIAEKKPLIELKPGVQEPAQITHMADPHHFYVRRARDEPLLTLMESQLRESLGDVPRDVAVGKTYAVNDGDSWRRGRVDGFDDGAKLLAYRVTCVDYGYTVTVSADKLRDIPTALAVGEQPRYPAPLALRCRLANCEPNAGVWRPDDTALVLRMVDKLPVLLHVRRAGAINECDVTTRGGVCVAPALSFHARATLVDPLLPYAELPREAPPRLLPANTSLRLKGSGDVHITHVVSPDKFYVRESALQVEYIKLCEELNNAYGAGNENGYIYFPKRAMLCVVQVGDQQQRNDASWARALVTSAATGDVCGVWLPDCGRQLAVPWHRLRAIEPRFTALKALAIESRLAGVSPRGGCWQLEASQLLNRRIGRILHAVVRVENRQRLGLVLLDLADEPVCVNQEVVDHGFADSNGSEDFQLLTAQNSQHRELKSKPSPINEIVTTNTVNETKMASDQEESHAERNESIRLEAKILLCESPSLIYISLVHQQKTFNELFEDIQKFYMKRKPRNDNWKVNDRCCAFCVQSETWRRATILKIETAQVTVFFTDFAQTETVPMTHLKKLHSDFEVIGDAAIKCHLAGIVPATEEWPSLTNEFLKDKLEQYKRVFVTKVGQFVDTSMPVELWVYHTEQGSALEPDASEWRCLNAELAARGLALPALQNIPQNENGRGEPTDDETLSFLNVRGSVHSWLLPMPPLPSSSGSGSGSDRRPDDPFVTQWLPPEPLRVTEFTAVPTYIDNDGIIYLHDVSQQDDLDFIRDTLQMAFKEPDPKARYCTWRVGEPCVARYYLDSHFYRGTIVEVNADQSNCLVQYVDYGNSEQCTFEDLRKRVALHQIPTQAHRCCLSRIKPTTEQWDLDVLDYVHKAIVEKKCFVKIAGPAVDGVTPVELKYDKLWFNDHLVEFDLAAYVDGAEPLERRFTPKKGKVTPKNNNVEVVKNTVIKLDCSSEPDYIVEEDVDSSQASGSPDSFKMRTLVDRGSSPNELDKQYKHVVPTLVVYVQHEEQEFDCNIPVINDTNSLELSIVRDPEFNSTYEELFETVKAEGAKLPSLDGIYEYKPCIALFEGNWYRASVLKYSEAKNLIKVRYVDYGNIGIVPLSDVREINRDWVRVPSVCVTVRLIGVRVNPDLLPDEVTKAFIETFLDKGPFRAKILNYDDTVPLVELRNSDGELVYHKLIKEKVLLQDAGDDLKS